MSIFRRGLRAKAVSIYDLAAVMATAKRSGGDAHAIAQEIVTRGLDVDAVIIELKRFIDLVGERDTNVSS